MQPKYKYLRPCTPRAFGIIIFVSIPPYVAQMLPDWHMIESVFIAGLAVLCILVTFYVPFGRPRI
jgi:hypothetical protein